MDTSLVALAGRLGAEESKVPFLRPALESLQKHVETATKLFSIHDTSACAPDLLAGLDEVTVLLKQVSSAQLTTAARSELTAELETKRQQFGQAANEALGIYFDLSVDQPGPPSAPSYFPRMEQTISLAIPGQRFNPTPSPYNRAKLPPHPAKVPLNLPPQRKSTPPKNKH